MKYLSRLVRGMVLAAGLVGCIDRDYGFLERRDTDSDVVQRYDAGIDGMDGMQLDGRTDGPAYDARKDAMPEDMRADRYVLGDVMSDGRMPDAGRDAYIVDSAVADVMPDANPVPDVGNDSFSPCFPAPCIFPDGPSPDAGIDSSVPDALVPDLGNDAPTCVGLPPSRECFAGIGECRRSGLEYATCDSGSWSSTEYSGCDAAAGEAGIEVCDELDNDCNGSIDDLLGIEILDSFDRADSEGLGSNALGNGWVESGGSNVWSIEGNTALSYGNSSSIPRASSDIGHRSTFSIMLRFNLSEVERVGGGGALMYSVNSSSGLVDGFSVHIAENTGSAHTLRRDNEEIVATASQLILANTDYLLHMRYDGSMLEARLWEVGSPKPVAALMSASVTDVDLSKTYMTLTGDFDGGESGTARVDYIKDGCE